MSRDKIIILSQQIFQFLSKEANFERVFEPPLLNKVARASVTEDWGLPWHLL